MNHRGQPMYEPFAAEFEAHARDSAYNAHYDRPAVLDLLGDVTGVRLLDAGCGPGLYAEELLARGAAVTAFDASPEMVRLARRRLGGRADVRVWDLERPLTWLPDATQDIVLMALVIHHVEDRPAALSELHRVLRPGGHLVVSTTHPTCDWLLTGGGYFDRMRVEETWQTRWRVRYWRQPLQAWCREFTDAGFLIERLVEPQPAGTMATRHPEAHDRLVHSPGFIAFRLLKP
ncbi:class I SAM-dependent methyltransferase [Micromonospora sp. NPDC049891]|uniref:class I SAM-dependent methyltransferase n=1 Tax=Micromonospora sp. NPDC049891 TaxID=3155655 RepID=UPI0033F3B2F1